MRTAFALTLSLLSLGLFAGYKVEVNKAPDFPRGVTAVALITPAAPGDFDVEWLESKFREYLSEEHHLTVVPASAVRQAMFDMGIQSITDQNRADIAKKLRVDAFVVPTIQFSGTKTEGTTIFNTAPGVFIASQDEVAQGRVTLLFVDGAAGKFLMQGSGKGESEFRSGKGIAWKVFREILEKAFGGN